MVIIIAITISMIIGIMHKTACMASICNAQHHSQYKCNLLNHQKYRFNVTVIWQKFWNWKRTAKFFFWESTENKISIMIVKNTPSVRKMIPFKIMATWIILKTILSGNFLSVSIYCTQTDSIELARFAIRYVTDDLFAVAHLFIYTRPRKLIQTPESKRKNTMFQMCAFATAFDQHFVFPSNHILLPHWRFTYLLIYWLPVHLLLICAHVISAYIMHIAYGCTGMHILPLHYNMYCVSHKLIENMIRWTRRSNVVVLKYFTVFEPRWSNLMLYAHIINWDKKWDHLMGIGTTDWLQCSLYTQKLDFQYHELISFII